MSSAKLKQERSNVSIASYLMLIFIVEWFNMIIFRLLSQLSPTQLANAVLNL